MSAKANDPIKSLYRIGGVAPLVAAAFYMSQFLIIFSDETYPTTPQGWFDLFQRSKLLGLFFLNALDIFSVALLGVMFLALYVALGQTNQAYMAIAAFCAFLGVAVFVSARADLVTATLTLSEQYAEATAEAQRSQLLAAGWAAHSITRATPETLGFFFMAVAGLITSIVILQGETFGKVTAYVGILASVFTFANQASIVIAPLLPAILLPLNGLLWLVWWLLASRGLFRLASEA